MRTTQELYQRIENAKRRLGVSRFPAWFRGHSDASHHLLPGILRQAHGLRHERNLFASFKTQAAGLADTKVGSWELLALMQHHGVPTRLLDWTHSLHTALFFALLGRITSPVLWILNPYELNQRATGKNLIFDDADPIGLDYYEAVCDRSWPHALPIALEAPWKSERIKSQRGCFTFHGTNPLPLEQACGACVKAVRIPPHLARALRADLRRSGVDHFRLFPDLDGLARHLKAQFRLGASSGARPEANQRAPGTNSEAARPEDCPDPGAPDEHPPR